MTKLNQKMLEVAPWRFRVLAIFLVAAISFTINQSWNYVKTNTLIEENTGAQNLNDFARSHSKEQILALIVREQKALSGNPLDIQALKNLAVLYSLAGDKEQSENLTTLIAGRTLQDKEVQAAALYQFLEKKNFGGALQKLDALARGIGFSSDFADIMSTIASTPDGLEVLVQYFAAHPKWRTDLIIYMVNNKKQDVNSIYALFAGLSKAGAPPTLLETQFFLQRLIADKSYEKAYFIWLDQLGENELRKVSGLYDGGFDLSFGNRYFDWTVTAIANAQVTLVPRESEENDQSLVVDFSSARTRFMNFSQILRLSPGEYSFTGESKAEKLENERGMVWQIFCLPAMDQSISKTEPLTGTSPWTNFKTNFAVPAENCSTQILRLELNATAVADTQVSGRVYYDNLKIERPELTVKTP